MPVPAAAVTAATTASRAGSPDADEPRARGIARRATLLLAIFAAASVVFSLVARLVYRGSYYPGWEVLGPAHGTYLLFTRPFTDVVATIFHHTRHFHFWANVSSLAYTIVPGALNQVLPWEYWGEGVTLLVVACGLAVAVRVAGLEWRQGWVALLAFGASPVLLSFSLMGYPAATTVLPHALALWIVTAEAARRSLWRTLAVGLMTVEISWHLYEGGRTMFFVWLAAAALLRPVALRVRLAWLALAALQIWMLDRYRSAATEDVKGSLFAMSSVAAWWDALLVVLDKLYVHPSLSLPILCTLALVCVLVVGRDRLFWLAVSGVQLVLLVLLAHISPGQLIARRYVTFEFYCLVLTLLLVRHLLRGEVALRPRAVASARTAVLAFLVAGNLAQIGATLWHFRTPAAASHHPLPFTSAVDDLKVHSRHVDWSHELSDRVLAGKKLILLYNFSTWAEWPTDPVATLERLYVRIGPKRFAESVFVFGEQSCRSDCLPIRPASSFADTMSALADGALGPVDDFEVHYLANDPPRDLAGAVHLVCERFICDDAEGDDFARRFRLLAPRGAAAGRL